MQGPLPPADPEPHLRTPAAPDATAPALALRRTTARARVLLWAACAAALTLLWGSFAEHSWYERKMSMEAVAERDANLASAVEQYVVRILRTSQAVNGLVAETYAGGAEPQRLLELLRNRARANDAFMELGFCAPDGSVFSTAAAGARVQAAACARWLAAPSPAGGMTLVAEADAVAMVSPCSTPAGACGAAVAIVARPTLLGVMHTIRLADDTVVELADRDGHLLAGWSSAGAETASAAQRLATSRSVLPWGFRVTVATLQADALAEFRMRRAWSMAMCLLVSVAALAGAAVLSRLQRKSQRLAQSLESAGAALQGMNRRLEATVQERTAQLAESYRELETFAYALAHDVRAPVAAISAYAEVLAPDIVRQGNDKHARYIQRITANAHHMGQMTEHLLGLASVGTQPLQLEPVDVARLAAEILDRQRDLDPGRRCRVVLHAALPVLADRALLRQLLDNLLSNAWKFTAARAEAVIEVAQEAGEDGWVVTHVRDNGAGFDARNAEGLFTPFRRMHHASEFPGNGIGLATVRRIVTLHGGRVWCESSEGAGATFSFALRRAGAPPAGAPGLSAPPAPAGAGR